MFSYIFCSSFFMYLDPIWAIFQFCKLHAVLAKNKASINKWIKKSLLIIIFHYHNKSQWQFRKSTTLFEKSNRQRIRKIVSNNNSLLTYCKFSARFRKRRGAYRTPPNICDGAQKQPPEMFFKERYSQKFRKIQRKTLVPESLLNKVAGLRPLFGIF